MPEIHFLRDQDTVPGSKNENISKRYTQFILGIDNLSLQANRQFSNYLLFQYILEFQNLESNLSFYYNLSLQVNLSFKLN